jgi:hypothetical protein
MSNKKFKIYCILIVIFLILIHNSVKSQTRNTMFFKEYSVINTCGDSIKNVSNDSVKKILNDKIGTTLLSILNKGVSYKMKLDTLIHIGKVYSSDDKFRIVSWNTPLNDGTHIFNAIIQLNPAKDSLCKLFVLKDSSQNYKGSITYLNFTPDKWYGALYYEILSSKIDKKIVYILLGMHFNDFFTNRKIIESMYFSEKGAPVFGYPVFKYNGKMQNRIVFDYSVNAVMNLKYENRMNMIVFDHLAPPTPLYSGNYKFYGPDFSFDGLKLEKNKWVYYPNIDYRKSKK